MTHRPMLDRALAPYPAPADTHPLDPDRPILDRAPDATLHEDVAEVLAAALAEPTVFGTAGALIAGLEARGLFILRSTIREVLG